MPEVREYLDRRGRSRYRDWLVTLDAVAKARVVTAVLRMENGNFSGSRSVGSGVSELRLDFGPGYRVYFGRDREHLVILLVGGSKRRQQADINTAHALWVEYRQRKQDDSDATNA